MALVTVQVQQFSDAGTPAAELRGVEVYDFRRPSTLPREHSRVLEVSFDTFARQWGTQLTSKVRVMAQVSCEQVLMLRYDDYAASLPSATAMVLCAVDASQAKGVVQFPTSAALAWVSSMLGGSPVRPDEDRRFTVIEQALVRRVMDDAIESLQYSLGALCPEGLTVDSFLYTSHFAQAAAPSEPMIVARFVIRVGDVIAPASLAIPAVAVLPQLGSTSAQRGPERFRAELHEQVARAPVTVDVRFTPTRVTPERVLSLAIGDVLPLPHPDHRPLDVAVGDTVIARAAVGTAGSRLACIVVTIEEDSA